MITLLRLLYISALARIEKLPKKTLTQFNYAVFDDFYFLEHLAVKKSCRGQKIGERMVKKFFETIDRPAFFEVETPVTELAKRRVEFYKRLGCVENPFGYIQPILWEGAERVELSIMSYPNRLDQSLFELWKEQVFNEVYCKL